MSLTLRKIKNTSFEDLYKRFLLNDNLSAIDYETILSLAVIFLNSTDVVVQKLGYRIIVLYSNRTFDYAPLYEVAINKGLYPIVKLIDSNHLSDSDKNLFTELNASFIEAYKENSVYLSEQQYVLNKFYYENKDSSVSVVAPTSYGKTELILKTIKDNPNKNICIITPTKSLLSQTRTRIINAKIEWLSKIIVHPDMYNENDQNCVAVLTQERLLRLLKNNPSLAFDYVIVDEAHNILEIDQREELLASVIVVLNKRNRNTAFKFLTPFIKDTANLKVRYTSYDLSSYTINEYVKTENIFLYDIRRNTGLRMYDQYMNQWYDCPNEAKDQTSVQFIQKKSGDKNIIYFNKPIDIEQFATEMLINIPDIQISEGLAKAIKDISEYVDPEYTLVKCLKKGIVYHHGSVPDTVRSYIEYLYVSFPEIKYIITSSTLLEGVNVPASKIFIMNNQKGRANLTHASFKNLIGRICRFSEIFNPEKGNLKKLEPEIYVVLDKYFPKNANIETYISSVMKEDKNFGDNVQNTLLEKTILTKENLKLLSRAREFIENYEEGTLDNYNERRSKTSVGKACILNNIKEIDIFSSEKRIQEKIDMSYQEGLIKDIGGMIDYICDVFLPYIMDDEKNNNILRFKHIPARAYYKMFLSWRIEGIPYNQMVTYTVRYWRSLNLIGDDTIVYVGKWGDLTRGGFYPLWTDVSKKDQSQLINLAIVRIKEEQDFIENTIMKFVEVLNDLNLMDEDLYYKIKYGTTKRIEIIMIKNGFSLPLTKLLLEKYSHFITFNIENETVELKSNLIQEMLVNQENQIIIYEAERNLIK